MGTSSLGFAFLLLSASLGLGSGGLLNRTIRHRRQALAPTRDNFTLPDSDRPVVFNHVYNINVPAGSICSVDLESPGSSESVSGEEAATAAVASASSSPGLHTTEQTVDEENQIVFTHRITVPRRACGCADAGERPDLKALLSRLEMLEAEVSALRGQCGGGEESGCCTAQVTGEVKTKPYCNGHGNYSSGSCGCVCEPGWSGPNCTELTCLEGCHAQGLCVDGRCHCFPGFAGDDCGQRACPLDCGENGLCVDGHCLCRQGFAGDDCSRADCPNGCLGRGRCADGGECVCDEPWAGPDCSQLACPRRCHGRGRCIDGACLCYPGYTGADCSALACPGDCGGRGACFEGVCVCDAGFEGEDCGRAACPNHCHGRGRCVDGRCSCEPGFAGDDCSELSCPAACLGRGSCVDGRCVCDPGFAGEDCSVRTCPEDCHGRGECGADGRCACFPGFAGEDCGELSCPEGCGGHGRCIDGQCACDVGFVGEDCGQKACPEGCPARGYCLDGECVCREGFSGDDCSVVVCPEDCGPHGRCLKGRCVCKEGYQGDACGDRSCPGGCQEMGRCVEGRCECDEGYIGEDCSQVSPPKDLRVTDGSPLTVDLSWTNERLVTGYVVSYAPTGPGGLRQEFAVSGDNTVAKIEGLEPGVEYLINVFATLSDKRSVPVSARVATSLPQPEGLKFKSVRESSVEVQWDPLDITFDGWELYIRNTKEENGKIVNILPPTQNHFDQWGLGPGQQYEVSLRVMKNNSTGPQTSRTFTTKIEGPQQVVVKDVTDSSALFSWSRPVTDVTGITVSYVPASDPSDQIVVDLADMDTQYSAGNLRPDTEYRISLTSRRGGVASDPFTTTFTTDLDGPRALQTLSQTDDSISLEWSNSVADVDGYRVKYTPFSGGSPSEELFPRAPEETTTATITGLRPGTEYGIGVTSVKDQRESLPATTNAATDLEVMDSTETSLALQWQKPEAKLSGYTLVYSSRDGQSHEVKLPPTATSHALDDLTPDTLYNVALTAERGPKNSLPVSLSASTASFTFYLAHSDVPELTGPDHNIISFALLDTPPDPQLSGAGLGEELASLNVSAHTSDGFELSWKLEPHRLYDGLVVECRGARQPSDRKVYRLRGDSTGSRVRGLNASTEYRIALHGIAGSKRFPLLKAAAVTAPEPTSPDTTTVPARSTGAENPPPDALGELRVTNVTSTSVGVGWWAPERTFDLFVVEVTAASPGGETSRTDHTVPGSARAAEIAGLSASTRYEITVYGLVEGVRSPPLKMFVDTEETNPRELTLAVSDTTWDSFNVSWSPPGGQDFEGFVVEVTNLEDPGQSQNLTLSGEAFSLLVSGLAPDTGYMVGVYAMHHKGFFLEPVYVEAVTGQIDGYVLEIIDSEWLTAPQEHNLSREARSYHVTGLRPSTDYVAFLYRVSRGSRTNAVSSFASTVAEPDLSRLVVSNITSDRFSLSWQTGEKAFDNFVVEVRESAVPSQAMGRALSGDARSTVMTGLKAATHYDIKMYASAGGQNSQPMFAAATTEEVPRLGPLTTASVSPDNLTLSWSTVSGHFDRFVVRVSDSLQQFDTLELTLPSPGGNVTVSELLDATDYDIELYGISHGRRSPSVFAHALTAPLPRHFHVVVTDSGWLLEPHKFTVPGNQTYLDLWGLITGIGYEVRLIGVSRSGLLSRPLTTVAVTEAEPEIEHLFVSDVTADGFRVSWAAADDLFDRFVIKMRDAKKLFSTHVRDALGHERTAVFAGLASGTEYDIELYGVTPEQRSHPILGVAQTGLGSPRGLQFSDVSDISATVRWAEPRSKVDSYRVIYVPLQEGPPMSVTVEGDQTQALLSGLVPGRTYRVTVVAVRGLDESHPSADTVTAALASPQGLEVLNITQISALLLWAPTAATVDGYVITYSAHSGQVSGHVVEFEMSSLVPATHYTVDVYATKDGQKGPSAVLDFTTDVDQPRDLTAGDVQTDGATLSWRPPRSELSGYTLSFTAGDGAVREVVLSPTASSYSMSDLRGSTEYTVTLQAHTADQHSQPLSTTFTTMGRLYRLPRDCGQALVNGDSSSGLHTIYLGGDEAQPMQVYCDMTTDQGGWLVFLRRQNGKLEFFRNWRNYTAGFGNMEDEFWLGLANLHRITSSAHYQLRVDLRDGGETAYAQYDKFSIAEPRSRYKLHVGAYSGTAGDSISYHQGRPFSTYDNDNDAAVTNCALSYKGAFWYKNCHRVNLMGKYGDESHSKGINWFHWKGHEHSIEFAEMKMRPVNLSSSESRRKRS
ncbi:hypothetical protein NHX12_027301 [Muraenolepis orangiensis]|uniref:Tenascin n=1 Tax=Muraenolepis orangiensis TaxID=630683 RepID=A0A9Q0EGC8_9TELE|nr:hypothetical protein NHX12_027301 [Muraenolepis orangiensis]